MMQLNRKAIVPAAAILIVLAGILSCGCTQAANVQPSALNAMIAHYDPLMIPLREVPHGLYQRMDGPVAPADLSPSMKKLGITEAYRAVYAASVPPAYGDAALEQNIMVLPDAKSGPAILEEYATLLTSGTNKNVLAVRLSDPVLGENSFAIKITETTMTGEESSHYIVGFVQSGLFETLTMSGTPETYQQLLTAAKAAAKQAKNH